MKFVENHLHKKCLKEKPHRWLAAFLLSPAHYSACHYRKKYKLNYVHAKKLFVFDIVLLTSILILGFFSIAWFLFTPRISDRVELTLSQSQERILSGDLVTYQIDYKNSSDVALLDPYLELGLPENFLLERLEALGNENKENSYIELNTLLPGESGTALIFGRLYHTPGIETGLSARLSYGIENKPIRETKTGRLFIVTRGSRLQTSIQAPDTLVNQGQTPITISLKNSSDADFKDIFLSLNRDLNGFTISDPQTEFGKVENNKWLIESLEPNQTIELEAQLGIDVPEGVESATLDLTPEILLNNQSVLQAKESKEFEIIEPNAKVTWLWQTEENSLAPGQVVPATIQIENSGDSLISNLVLEFNLPSSVVDIGRFVNLNRGALRESNFVINSNNNAGLQRLLPGEVKQIELSVPIRSAITNVVEPILQFSPRLSANVADLSETRISVIGSSTRLPIATGLSVDGHLRYYTAEGDQIGRGPLPPQIGKETKYWAIYNIKNTSSAIRNLNFSAILSNIARPTGRSSVSHGQDVSFDDVRKVSWSIKDLLPQEEVGIFFELGFTPDASHIGRTPTLIENAQVWATDTFTARDLRAQSGAVDISLTEDSIGRSKGVTPR